MNDHQLPDDVRRWPSDPYALLGVSSDVSLRDLKKAYTRLIRQFRPEDAPEQFRKIRDAYEMIERYTKYSGFAMPPLSAPAPPLEPERGETVQTPAHTSDEIPAFDAPMPKDEPASQPRPFDLEIGPPSSPFPKQDELTLLWEKACSGEEEEAYRRLRAIYNENPRETDILLRLYWLHSIFPDLDHVRHPCEWLVESLRVSGLAAQSRELYRRYVVNHPAEALSERYTRLLETPAPVVMLATLVEWRWQAAGRLRDPDVIVDDLEALQSRVLRDDEDTWVRLLFFAADQLAWFVEPGPCRAFQKCRHDLEELEHVQVRHGESFTRLDILTELSEEWKRMTSSTGELRRHREAWSALLKLIPLSWTRPLAEQRVLVLQHFENTLWHPEAGLDVLDDVLQWAPRLLVQLARTLETLVFSASYRQANWPSDDEIEARTRRFVATVDTDNFPVFRLKMLGFCFRECLPPERMAEVIAHRCPDARLVNLFNLIQNDWPLRSLCLAHRLFWA